MTARPAPGSSAAGSVLPGVPAVAAGTRSTLRTGRERLPSGSGWVPPPAPGAGPPPDPGLVERVRARLADGVVAGRSGPVVPTPAAVAAALRAEAGELCGDAQLLAVLGRLRSEIVGAGPLEPLLRDPRVTDVLVNGPEQVWVDRGAGLERVDVTFPDEAAVRSLARRLVAPSGRPLDDAHPWVDARLPDGTRLHAALPPVAPDGTCLSLRVARHAARGLDDLVVLGGLPPPGAALLRALVAARLALLVSGGTGSGKTTLLAALLGEIDSRERLVLVEDSGELRPRHPHVVRLECRPANAEGVGAVGLGDLVRQALRMRPDRLVVGEVRGGEVADLLAALNTGHEGGCGTLHANGAGEVPARLEALGAMAGLAREALHSQVAAAVQAVVHLVRERAGQRRVAEVRVLVPDRAGLVRAVPAVRLDGLGLRPVRPGVDRLVEACGERGVDLRGLLEAGARPGVGR
jgi:pilus assembly protein CpaF